jgi:uncharacterized protein (TIGR00375 family)
VVKVIADLHIHSRFSRATSKDLNPVSLERFARVKGIDLIGSGDCTHPAWLAELGEHLEEAEEGFFTLKKEFRTSNTAPRFVLTGEISTIYKKGDKTRKIHHVVILPDFKAAAVFQAKLERVGNIRSDGRPILGIDSRTLLALLLEADERSLLIPAHIWTPWFSVLGARSGFDAIDECYGDLATYIPAIETGLSSNPPMNWALSSLDRFSIISNSDAHSPEKLGREATALNMDRSYSSLAKALRPHDEIPNGSTAEILYTIEFFPQEGKYHYDGHRKCGVSIGPEDLQQLSGAAGADILCPVCGRPLTMGVMRRVLELADRKPVDEWGVCPQAEQNSTVNPGPQRRPNQRPYVSLIPLRELAGELLETGPASKKVENAYVALIQQAGSELSLLIDMDLKDVAKLRASGIPGERLAEAISRMRKGQVLVQPGYDGEYGVIKVFSPDAASSAATLFPEEETPPLFETTLRPATKAPSSKPLPLAGPDLHVREQGGQKDPAQGFAPDIRQQAAIEHEGDRTLIIAGPGTGKTATLSARITRLIESGVDPAQILALSFTVKAAHELGERIRGSAAVTTATFHSLCATLLRTVPQAAPLRADFTIISDTERDAILQETCAASAEGGKGKIRPQGLGTYIESRKRFLLLPGQSTLDLGDEQQDLARIAESLGLPDMDMEKEELYRAYQERLRTTTTPGGETDRVLLDFDDLVGETARFLALNSEVRRRYQEQYRYIFVDEYQDINFAQYALIRLLTSNGGQQNTGQKLWVIGDPNQAIYGFRGADKRFIDRFAVDYPEAALFRLERSFRCAAPIINAAGTLVDAPLQGTDSAVSLFRTEAPSEKAEAEGIARRISALIGGASFFAHDSGVADSDQAGPGPTASLSNIAILLRAANLADPIIKALGDHGIPYTRSGEKPWWETEPCASLLVFLRENVSTGTASQNTGLNSLPPAQAVRRAWELCGKKGTANSKTAAAKNSPPASPPPPMLVERLIATAAFYEDLRVFLDTLAVDRGEDGAGPVMDSVSVEGENSSGVQIMTIHASKGLEFDHVFVPALEDGILPFTLYEKEHPRLIEEEQRLLYVAMTRAKTGLYLSWARTRLHRGRILENPPSRYLNKLETLIPLEAPVPIRRRSKPGDAQLELF